MKLALISAGPSAPQYKNCTDQFQYVAAINASAVSPWIGPHHLAAMRDETYLLEPRYFTPSAILTEYKHTQLAHRRVPSAKIYDVAKLAPPPIRKHNCWQYTATSAFFFCLNVIRPTEIHLFGFDMLDGYGISNKSAAYSRKRHQWEYPEYEYCLNYAKEHNIDIHKS